MSELKKLGFVDSKDRDVYPRIILSISALEKQGKTHFALTAPGPIAMFSTDIGEEGVVGKFKKKIMILDVARIDEDAAEKAPLEWDKFKKAYNHCLRSKEVRSIVIDTATEIWELLRMARFGRLTQVMPYQYGPVNAEYRTLIRDAYNFDKNLILIHKMKAQYVNDKRTGEWERSGFSDTGFLVQVNTQIYRYAPEDGGAFCLWVKDCRQNPELAGEVLEGDLCTFPMLAMMVLPDVDPKKWED
jgi:hypothetical protein